MKKKDERVWRSMIERYQTITLKVFRGRSGVGQGYCKQLAGAGAPAFLSNMPATSHFVLRVSPLEEESRLLVTFLAQIMEQRGVCFRRELRSPLVQFRKNWQQVGLGIGRGHELHGLLQFQKRF